MEFNGYLFYTLLLLALIDLGTTERLKRRKSTTPEPPPAEDEVDTSVTGRELNLLKREETFRLREVAFRERELNVTLREEKLREREFKITVREDKVADREKNAGKEKKCTGGGGGAEVPETHDLFKERYDPVTMKYYEIGISEPCGENMRFFAIPEENSNEGRCDCDYHQCSRPLIYSAKYNQCFWAWTQGPCEQNEWYIFNETLHGVCQRNDCPKSLSYGQPKYYFKDMDDGICYETTTKGYCEMEDERLSHTPEDPIPKCRSHTLCAPISHPPQQLCIPGNRRHWEGPCLA